MLRTAIGSSVSAMDGWWTRSGEDGRPRKAARGRAESAAANTHGRPRRQGERLPGRPGDRLRAGCLQGEQGERPRVTRAGGELPTRLSAAASTAEVSAAAEATARSGRELRLRLGFVHDERPALELVLVELGDCLLGLGIGGHLDE